jgi:PKD repeat protein
LSEALNDQKANIMKVFIFTFLLLISGLTASIAQEWISLLPQEKLEKGRLTFFEIQDAFYHYWEPYEVKNSYYEKDGERIRAPYYKQFKRWEWYWQSRVDPQTGEFPDLSVLDEYYSGHRENRSTGGNWVSLGPNTSPGGYAGLGRLNCVAFVPGTTTEYYTGAASGGIWHTIDDGATWTVLNDSVPVLGVSDIIVINPPIGPHTLYIATGDRDGGALWSLGGQQSNDNNSIGVLKSIDGGATWTTTGLTFTASQKVRINRLLMDPTSGYQNMYAATTNGVYKTTDGGVNWTLTTTTAFIDMEFKPGDPTTLYASTEGSSTTAIYLSTNSGSSFSQVASYSGIRTELAVSYNQPTWVYAVVASTNSGLLGVYKSTNSGASYSQVFNGTISGNNLLGWSCSGTGTGGQGWYDLCIAADPNNANVVYVGGVNTWKTSNGGTSFNIVNHWSGCTGIQTVHADKHYFAFQGNSSTLFECNDGGLYKTSDGGSSWTHLSSGKAISQIYRLGVGQTAADEVITGLQDNGTKALLTGTWTDVIGGDGFECIVNYTNQNVQYGALYYGSIYRTTDYWNNSVNITGSLPGSGAWCTPYIIDPVNHQTLYVGYKDVYKTTNQGSSWSQISNQGSSTNLQSMAISASNTSYIYAATHGNIYRTTNGGGAAQTWTNITSNLPVGSSNITYIAVDHTDPNHVWVSMGAYNSHGVYETTNGGGSWSNISSGLPLLPVMCVIQNTQYSGIELYAATDVGVYVKRDAANWVPFNDGLPNVVVTELDIYYDGSNPDDSRIYAATYGRGVWWSDLYNPYAAPVADFTGAPTSGLPPLNVGFTDLSQNTVNTWDWDFGDGNTSTQQNPMNIYNDPGLYTVKLVVTGPGGSDSTTKTDYIQVNYFPPTCDFTADITTGIFPLTVNFTDLSLDSVDTWSWDFGDGGTSTVQHPEHIYQDPGLYTVSLTVTGPGGSDTHTKTDYITVNYPAPSAAFSGNPTSGIAPLSVSFTDLSTDTVNAWSWSFGDGSFSSLQHPVHQYASSGNYTVILTVTGPGGTDTETKYNYINVSDAAPLADFTGYPTSGHFPLTVNFTDQTSGVVNSWKWYFDDGGTSIQQNPSHTYLFSGEYTVSLKVSGPGGSDSIAKLNYITVLVGIEEIDDANLRVFPNPCRDYLLIESNRPVGSIQISDIMGNLVKDLKVDCPAPCEWRVDMLDVHPGIYFCRIVMNDGNMVLMKVLKR